MSRYEEFETEDGSITFRNMDVDECYHTKSGCFEEALEKHVKPSGILEKANKQDEVIIGDVCFGLGYNSLLALHEIKRANPECKVTIIGFENDPHMMEKAATLSMKPYEKESKIIKAMLQPPFQYNSENIQGSVWVGDLRKMFPYAPDETFDVIFYDPFSPKKQPELWSEELFKDAYRSLKKSGRLTTYSCARAVRDTMRKAGFTVIDGPIVGRRSPSTIAIKE
ncbi:MAG: tRNA (5-methylaminomethyl-2-thiouridine)(34)-methyltransferase MnmD [Nanobdellota archaeon]